MTSADIGYAASAIAGYFADEVADPAGGSTSFPIPTSGAWQEAFATPDGGEVNTDGCGAVEYADADDDNAAMETDTDGDVHDDDALPAGANVLIAGCGEVASADASAACGADEITGSGDTPYAVDNADAANVETEAVGAVAPAVEEADVAVAAMLGYGDAEELEAEPPGGAIDALVRTDAGVAEAVELPATAAIPTFTPPERRRTTVIG